MQSISSTESSFDGHKMSRYHRANGSSGLNGILDDSDDDDDDDLLVGQLHVVYYRYLHNIFSQVPFTLIWPSVL